MSSRLLRPLPLWYTGHMSKLWTPNADTGSPFQGVSLFGPREFVERECVRVLPNGKRVKITMKDGRKVFQIEHDHHLDAVVRPDTIRVKIRRET